MIRYGPMLLQKGNELETLNIKICLKLGTLFEYGQ